MLLCLWLFCIAANESFMHSSLSLTNGEFYWGPFIIILTSQAAPSVYGPFRNCQSWSLLIVYGQFIQID